MNVRINLDEFGLLAFDKYQEIYDIGYRRGLEVMDSIKAKIKVRVPKATVEASREKFKGRYTRSENQQGVCPRRNDD